MTWLKSRWWVWIQGGESQTPEPKTNTITESKYDVIYQMRWSDILNRRGLLKVFELPTHIWLIRLRRGRKSGDVPGPHGAPLSWERRNAQRSRPHARPHTGPARSPSDSLPPNASVWRRGTGDRRSAHRICGKEALQQDRMLPPLRSPPHSLRFSRDEWPLRQTGHVSHLHLFNLFKLKQ